MKLVQEPMGFASAKVYRKALFETGIQRSALRVDDAEKGYERLLQAWVLFSTKPTAMKPVKPAVFNVTLRQQYSLFKIL